MQFTNSKEYGSFCKWVFIFSRINEGTFSLRVQTI